MGQESRPRGGYLQQVKGAQAVAEVTVSGLTAASLRYEAFYVNTKQRISGLIGSEKNKM
jgi:hypothetical protein